MRTYLSVISAALATATAVLLFQVARDENPLFTVAAILWTISAVCFLVGAIGRSVAAHLEKLPPRSEPRDRR